jgi:hypothetical protein
MNLFNADDVVLNCAWSVIQPKQPSFGGSVLSSFQVLGILAQCPKYRTHLAPFCTRFPRRGGRIRGTQQPGNEKPSAKLWFQPAGGCVHAGGSEKAKDGFFIGSDALGGSRS